MPLTPYLHGEVFEPDIVAMMTQAFEDVLARLQLRDRSDPLVEIVAREVIACGRRGERDPSACVDRALRAIGRS